MALPEHSFPWWAGAGLSHARVLVPPPQVAGQALHWPHPPSIGVRVGDFVGRFVGHGAVLHACVLPPVHALPWQLGAGFVHVRSFVPPPQLAEQPPHALHAPSTSPHDAELEAPPAHALPWQLGLGLSQLRVRVFEHALQLL